MKALIKKKWGYKPVIGTFNIILGKSTPNFCGIVLYLSNPFYTICGKDTVKKPNRIKLDYKHILHRI